MLPMAFPKTIAAYNEKNHKGAYFSFILDKLFCPKERYDGCMDNSFNT
jgi:hypothetical protein